MTEHWCGKCKRWTEQTYDEKGEVWSCDLCGNMAEIVFEQPGSNVPSILYSSEGFIFKGGEK